MNRLLVRAKALNTIINQGRSICTTNSLSAGFTKDYKPGPYPKTEEERKAAAKKYGMLPEDYEPYPDNGLGFGDYPKMPEVSTDMKSPFEEYDDPYLKRNYAEPVGSFFYFCRFLFVDFY